MTDIILRAQPSTLQVVATALRRLEADNGPSYPGVPVSAIHP
jgi:hypothetical protein